MDKPKSFDELPPKLQAEILQNGKNMRRFYTVPVEKRQAFLDSVCKLNSKKEIDDFISGNP